MRKNIVSLMKEKREFKGIFASFRINLSNQIIAGWETFATIDTRISHIFNDLKFNGPLCWY